MGITRDLDARIVDENVQLTQLFHSRADHPTHVFLLRDICLDEAFLHSARANLAHTSVVPVADLGLRFLRALPAAHVVDGYVGTFVTKPDRNCLSDSTAGSGHQYVLSF